MKIYTRGGDKGETGLFGGTRVPKSHPRVEAYGDVDELNCAIGMARSLLGKEHANLDAALERVQSECFVVGALLATPSDKLGKLTAPFDKGLPADAPTRLENEIDAYEKELTPLTSFILPGGAAAGASLHVARAICRRAERKVVNMSKNEKIPDGVIVYLNRLSDWLFVTARLANSLSHSAEKPWTGLAK